MKHRSVRSVRSGIGSLVFAAGLVAVTVAAPAFAQEEEDDGASYTVSEFAYRRLEKAQEALEKKNFKVANSTLEDLSKRKSLSPYEQALMWQTWAYVHVTQENLPKAIEAMTKALEQDAFPKEVELSTRFNLGQVYLAAEQPKQGARVLVAWANEVDDPSPDALYTVAVAAAQADDNATSLDFINRAIRKKRNPPEEWLQLKLVSLVKLERWGGAIETMAGLVERKPDDVERWKQLSALYAQARRLQESVATLQLAFRLDLLTKAADIRLLAQNLIAAGVPLEAAQVLRRALDQGWMERNGEHLELMATAYVNAAETDRAIEPLDAAAKATGKAELYMELGRVHLAEKNWQEAASALAKAVSSGDLRQPGQAYIMLGMARHRLQRIAEARAAFQKALDYRNTKSTAQSWLGYLAAED